MRQGRAAGQRKPRCLSRRVAPPITLPVVTNNLEDPATTWKGGPPAPPSSAVAGSVVGGGPGPTGPQGEPQNFAPNSNNNNNSNSSNSQQQNSFSSSSGPGPPQGGVGPNSGPGPGGGGGPGPGGGPNYQGGGGGPFHQQQGPPGGAGSPAGAPYQGGPPPGSTTPQYTASPAPSGSSTPGPQQGPNQFPGGPPNNSGPPYNGPGPGGPFGSPSGGGPPPFGRPGSSGPFVGGPGPGGNPHFVGNPGPGPHNFGPPPGAGGFGMPPGSPFGPGPGGGGHPMGGPGGGPGGPMEPGHHGMMGRQMPGPMPVDQGPVLNTSTICNGAQNLVVGAPAPQGPHHHPHQQRMGPVVPMCPMVGPHLHNDPFYCSPFGNPYYRSLPVPRRHTPYFGQPDYRIYELNKRLQQRTEVFSQESDNLWWDAFATEFFEDDASLTLAFCLEDGPKRYTIGRTLIPRYFRSIFEGGVTELYYNMKHPKESFHNTSITLDCDQCTMITHHGKPLFTKVCTEGRLILEFTFDDLMRIKSWHFAVRTHRELIPRSVVQDPNMIEQLSNNITRQGITNSTLNYLRLCVILEPMQELMSRHKAYALSPRDCLKTTLFQKWQRMVAPPGKRESQRPANKRRKRKGSNSGGAANNATPAPNKKRSPGPNFSLASQDVMVVGEPSLMGGEFGDEDERLITRLENTQYDAAANSMDHHHHHSSSGGGGGGGSGGAGGPAQTHGGPPGGQSPHENHGGPPGGPYHGPGSDSPMPVVNTNSWGAPGGGGGGVGPGVGGDRGVDRGGASTTRRARSWRWWWGP